MKKKWLLYLTIIIITAASAAKTKAVVSKKLLNAADLKSCWRSAVALDENEKIADITIEQKYLFIITDKNYLFCLDRNNGKLMLAALLCEQNMPVSRPVVQQNDAYIVAANRLIKFNLQQGTETLRMNLEIPVIAAAAANEDYIYLAGLDKKLHAMENKTIHEIFRVTADDVSAVTAVVSLDSKVVFTTNSGNVIAMAADSPKRLWQFDAVKAVVAKPAHRNGNIYVSSKDTILYKLDAETGKMIWKAHTGAMLDSPPKAAGKVIYQYAQGKGLYAFDAEDGKKLWLAGDGIEMLATDKDTAYILTTDKKCAVINNKNGEKIKTINFAPVTAAGCNVYDEKIYITGGSSVMCIEPKDN